MTDYLNTGSRQVDKETGIYARLRTHDRISAFFKSKTPPKIEVLKLKHHSPTAQYNENVSWRLPTDLMDLISLYLFGLRFCACCTEMHD